MAVEQDTHGCSVSPQYYTFYYTQVAADVPMAVEQDKHGCSVLTPPQYYTFYYTQVAADVPMAVEQDTHGCQTLVIAGLEEDLRKYYPQVVRNLKIYIDKKNPCHC
jgi:hypothetical protein